MRLKAVFASLLSALLLLQPMWAQDAPQSAPQAPPAQQRMTEPDYSKGAPVWPHFTRVFKQPYVAEVNMGNSNRLESLLRDGNLYLSLDDAIALSLENNLDIAFMRYQSLVSDTDILRAKAGFPIRNLVVFGGTSSLSTGSSATGGTGVNPIGSTTNASTITTFASGSTIAPNGGVSVVGTSFIGGSTIPQLDPVFTTTVGWAHNSTPQSSSFVSGTNTLIAEGATTTMGYSQAFTTGTAFSLNFTSATVNSNSLRNLINPSISSGLTLNFVQPLLQGFGRSMNARYLVIARNNREASDLLFKQQVIQTVSQVANLYWDLVGFNENVRVVREALELANKLHEDNQKQVEIGTLAPISIVQAEAEVAARQQDLTLAETQVQQQEVILINALSKDGIASPSVAQAHIIPTTHLSIPAAEPVQPIQDLIGIALQGRPELAQARIGVTNTDIALKGTRNELLPQLNLVGSMTNNALAGQQLSAATPVSPFFEGGLGTALGQVFSRNFPTYSVGVQLNVPVRNRAAQADMAAAILQYRQAEIRMRQAENEVRLEVRNALIGLQQARARMEAATKSRILQEQTLDAEQKKYALGASTIYLVIQVQRDLSSAREVEVAAINNYAKARVEIDRASGQTIVKNNIVLQEAYDGTVRKTPDPIPAATPQR